MRACSTYTTPPPPSREAGGGELRWRGWSPVSSSWGLTGDCPLSLPLKRWEKASLRPSVMRRCWECHRHAPGKGKFKGSQEVRWYLKGVHDTYAPRDVFVSDVKLLKWFGKCGSVAACSRFGRSSRQDDSSQLINFYS